ncbi:MAG TPA: asparagine synthase (glutamine-hydrolyzing) [Bacteroidia bacterium]|nr:asparagine synthase (glutamine-hydrolyzing) [Bacteroidia bacterium]
MCGIAGFYSREKIFSEEDLRTMTRALSHRGPNAVGYFSDDVTSLGHRRLSIIDLSERANQPMTSHNDRFVIIYNGEIYNFTEIGAKLKTGSLQNESAQLRTSSDTEVILEAFVKYGVDFVTQLNGMFALAIYDKTLQELYLFRDRVGIKPLFYYWDGKNFAFASELKALQKVHAIPKVVNEKAVGDFLHYGYIPTPYTIYNNIYKMNSGSWMKISADGIDLHKYWDVRNKISNNIVTNREQAMVKLSDLMISSVQYQLKSDVPFGVFLSGGIDSSLVTAQAVMLSSVKVNTFSIGFEENSHNESEYAKAIAKYLGTDHHEFIVSYKDALNLIEDMFDCYDEPFADSSAIPTLLVSKLAKQYVTVTLSGEGGDELFFGYGSYRWARRLNNPVMKAFHKPLASVFSYMPTRYKRVGKLLDYSDKKNLRSHIFSQEQYLFSEHELYGLLMNGYAGSSYIEETTTAPNLLRVFDDSLDSGKINVRERNLDAMESQALFDLQYYLQDDLLTKVDRASMHYGLETRVPYLDHRVVEFALNLSPHLKFKNGISKYILKQILYQYIPRHLFDRPKQGFAIPLNIWLRKELKYLIDEFLSESMINKYGIVSYDEVDKLKKMFFSDVDYVYNRLWLLIVLHKWFEKNRH